MTTYQLTVKTMFGDRTLSYTDKQEYLEAREHAIIFNVLIKDEIDIAVKRSVEAVKSGWWKDVHIEEEF